MQTQSSDIKICPISISPLRKLLSLPFSALSPRCGLIPISYQPKQSFEIDGSSPPIGKKSLSHSKWDKEYPVTPISLPRLWYIFHGLTHISRNPYLGWKLLPPVLRNLTYPQKLLNWDPSCFTCLKYEYIKPTPCIFILGQPKRVSQFSSSVSGNRMIGILGRPHSSFPDSSADRDTLPSQRNIGTWY